MGEEKGPLGELDWATHAAEVSSVCSCDVFEVRAISLKSISSTEALGNSNSFLG